MISHFGQAGNSKIVLTNNGFHLQNLLFLRAGLVVCILRSTNPFDW